MISEIDKGGESPDEDDWSNSELDKDKSDEGEANQGGKNKGSDVDDKEIADGRNVKDPLLDDDRKINGETFKYFN